MTDDLPQLVSELRSIASQNVCDLPNMGDEAHEPPEITWGELDAIGRTADAAATALDTLTRALAERTQERDTLLAELRADPEGLPNLLRINREYAERCNQDTNKALAAVREARAETWEAAASAFYATADEAGKYSETGRVLAATADIFTRHATAARAGQP